MIELFNLSDHLPASGSRYLLAVKRSEGSLAGVREDGRVMMHQHVENALKRAERFGKTNSMPCYVVKVNALGVGAVINPSIEAEYGSW